jgi:hypothetical protein
MVWPPIAGQAINTGADEEVRTQLLRQAVKFVDVTFSVADMNAARWIAESLDRLPQIVEPAHAFLFLDRNPGRIDLLLQRGRSLELGACPHLDGRQAQRQAVDCDHQAGVHENAA